MKQRLSAFSTVLALAAGLSITVGAGTAEAEWAFVTNSNESGPGSFGAAISLASSNPSISRVQFTKKVTINLSQTVWFSGPQDLSIGGLFSTLDASNIDGGPAFRATGGGDLVMSNLKVRNSELEGIAVEVPGSATGTVDVSLVNVDILDNDGHGVLVDDQVANSNASVAVVVASSFFRGNGFGTIDRDGLRVNEGGGGDLRLTLLFSRFEENGADGVEVDERDAGDVHLNMANSHVTRNGSFCDVFPDVCAVIADEGYDPDDGFDIDEAGAGSILGSVVNSSANENYEQGFDFNENDLGDLRVNMRNVEANGNAQEGIEYEEDDDSAGGGDIVVTMFRITANGNQDGDAGLKLREKGAGNVAATLNVVEASNNLIRGIEVREDADGSLQATISRATTLLNAGDGIRFDENSTGDLTASVSDSTSSNNTAAGINADSQAPTVVGTLQLTNVTLSGNTPDQLLTGVVLLP